MWSFTNCLLQTELIRAGEMPLETSSGKMPSYSANGSAIGRFIRFLINASIG
jgi:hypothetical protein